MTFAEHEHALWAAHDVKGRKQVREKAMKAAMLALTQVFEPHVKKLKIEWEPGYGHDVLSWEGDRICIVLFRDSGWDPAHLRRPIAEPVNMAFYANSEWEYVSGGTVAECVLRLQAEICKQQEALLFLAKVITAGQLLASQL